MFIQKQVLICFYHHLIGTSHSFSGAEYCLIILESIFMVTWTELFPGVLDLKTNGKYGCSSAHFTVAVFTYFLILWRKCDDLQSNIGEEDDLLCL